MGSGSETLIGGYVGTGAAQTVKCQGRRLRSVEIINMTDSIIAKKYENHADSNHTQIAQNGAITQVTTEGVTLEVDGGFSLGTDAGVNAADKQCYFKAEFA